MTLYAVGDIQGCAKTLKVLLKRIRFDQTKDHLWLVGDLVNRGPRSARVLRMVRELGNSATCVLGNHDLHLLAAAAGARAQSWSDTFDDVLDARDADELLDWLRTRPLIHRDKERRRVLVHAGIPPVWKVKEALQHAKEIEERLAGPKWWKALTGMYGESPAQWSPDLAAGDRRRFTLNALTRMRFCDKAGRLDFRYSGPPGSQPKRLIPWFDIPERAARKWQVVFGHWSALGVVLRDDIAALDSGCVWGGELTAVPLEPAGDPIAVECRD